MQVGLSISLKQVGSFTMSRKLSNTQNLLILGFDISALKSLNTIKFSYLKDHVDQMQLITEITIDNCSESTKTF